MDLLAAIVESRPLGNHGPHTLAIVLAVAASVYAASVLWRAPSMSKVLAAASAVYLPVFFYELHETVFHFADFFVKFNANSGTVLLPLTVLASWLIFYRGTFSLINGYDFNLLAWGAVVVYCVVWAVSGFHVSLPAATYTGPWSWTFDFWANAAEGGYTVLFTVVFVRCWRRGVKPNALMGALLS